MKRSLLKKLAISGVAVASSFSSAFAEDDQAPDTRFFASANYNALFPDIDRGASGEQVGWNVTLGKYINSWLALEATYGENDIDTLSPKPELTNYGVATLLFPAGRGYGMYTVIGGGQVETEISGSKDKHTYYDAGIGFMKPVSDAGSQLRADVRLRHTAHDGDLSATVNSFNDIMMNVGVLIPFGEQTNEHARPFFEGEQDHRFYVGASASQIIADHSPTFDGVTTTPVDDTTSYQAVIGTRAGEAINMELRYHSADLDKRDNSGEVSYSGWAVDFPIFIHRNPTFAPYFIAGVGRGEIEDVVANITNETTTTDFGFGFLTSFTDYRFGIRFDARYRTYYDAKTGDDNQGIFNLGFHMPIGGAPVPPDDDGDGVPNIDDQCPDTPAGTPVDEQGCPLDSDGDGVIDPNDACPDTPPGTEVDASGCKLDGDQDGDGVKDSVDECPDTPEGTEVDAKGCAIDSDGDGVINSKDECPDTPEGLEVNGVGCVAKQSLILEGVNFEFNSDKLTPNAERILDKVAKSLADNPTIKAEVAGHTDWVGSASYNQELSQARAESVKSYLVENGVEDGNLTATGYGEDTPIADNETDDGRARNRRVELNVEEQE